MGVVHTIYGPCSGGLGVKNKNHGHAYFFLIFKILNLVRGRGSLRGQPDQAHHLHRLHVINRPWRALALGWLAQPYFRAYGAARGGVPCARDWAIFAPSPPGRPEPPWRKGTLVSIPNGHHMATTAGPRHGGGTTGRVRVRTGTLAPCLRSVARVRGDHGPRVGGVPAPGRRPRRRSRRRLGHRGVIRGDPGQ
jgi:hypothetical protein